MDCGGFCSLCIMLCCALEQSTGMVIIKVKIKNIDNHLPLPIKGVGCFQWFIVCIVCAIQQMESVLKG